MNGKEIALVGSGNVCSIASRHDMQALAITSRYVGSSSNKNVAIDETSAGGTLDVVLDSVIQYSTDRNASDLLQSIGMEKPVAANYQQDYQPLEERMVQHPIKN